MKKTKTSRGFILYEFQDGSSEKCSLQESSRADKFEVWLGLDRDTIPIHPVLGVPLGVRMKIDQKLARKLGLKLIAFSETGII